MTDFAEIKVTAGFERLKSLVSCYNNLYLMTQIKIMEILKHFKP